MDSPHRELEQLRQHHAALQNRADELHGLLAQKLLEPHPPDEELALVKHELRKVRDLMWQLNSLILLRSA